MNKNKLLCIFCVGLFLFCLILMYSCASVEEIARDDRFIAYSNGVVKDTKTGLEWVAGPDKTTTCYMAKLWVESLSIDGGEWRMPTVKELKTLYQKGKGERNMTQLLKTAGWWVWSGEAKELSFGFRYGIPYKIKCYYSSYHRGFAVRSLKELSKKEVPVDKPAPIPAQKMLRECFQDTIKTGGLVWEELGQTPGFEDFNIEFKLHFVTNDMYVIATYTIAEGVEVDREYLKQRTSEIIYQNFRNRLSRIEHKWLVQSVTELVE